jgi:Protein of unknown function (DUF3349)
MHATEPNHWRQREDPDVSNTTPQVDVGPLADTREASHESVIKRVLNWLTAGYPSGVPPTERYALIALLHRTLTTDEVQQVIATLTTEQSPALEDGVISDDEIRDMISKVIEDAPSESDLRKVSSRLAAAGWPLEGTFRKAQ